MWHYLSFADPERPEETQFLGAVIVEADHFLDAVRKAHALGINPGVEVLGIDLPDDKLPAAKFRNRLLQMEDIRDAFEHTGSRALLRGGAGCQTRI